MDLIAHLDEIFLKKNNQLFFYRQLINNLESLFPGIVVNRTESGLILKNFKKEELDRLMNVPGLANFAPVVVSGTSIEEIKQAVDQLSFPTQVDGFKIKTERSFKSYPLTSMEVSALIGGYVAKKYHWSVSLEKPKICIHINIGKDEALVYNNILNGSGGLPTGSTGKVLCLISGGIDSPVAAFQMMKRGAEIGLIHFQSQGAESPQKIIDLGKTLSRYQPNINLYIVPFGVWQREIIKNIPADYRMILNRRLMFKIAEFVAIRNGYRALTTGDSLGQVASQTLENLEAVYEAVKMLKLPPLIGMNKKEITDLASKIKTLAISQIPYEDCCSLFVARHPQTRAKLEHVLTMEKSLDLSALDKTEVITYYISTT